MWQIWLFPASYFNYLIICRLFGGELIKEFEWKEPNAFIIFQITTNGKNKHVVDDTIKRVKSICSKFNFNNYRIDVVTDEGCPVDYDANVIVVPKNYKPKNAKYKARALHYAVEYRRKMNENKRNIWIFHLDDESKITEQTLKAISNHINRCGEPISEGLIVYSNNFNKASVITRIADCLRPTCCYECKFMTKYGLVTHLHGSNLLVRSDVEDKIGFDFNTIAEDSMFGIEAIKKGYKIGWHYGVVVEQPVFNVKDLFKQRSRWFKGGLQNVLRCTSKIKYILLLKLLSWFLGLPSLITAFLCIFHPEHIPLVAKLFLLPGTSMWILSYQIGITHNKGSKKDRLFALLLLPVVGLVETIPAFFFYIFSRKGFSVVKK